MYFLSEDVRLDTIRPGTLIYRKNPRREYLAENARAVCTAEGFLAKAVQINTQKARARSSDTYIQSFSFRGVRRGDGPTGM